MAERAPPTAPAKPLNPIIDPTDEIATPLKEITEKLVEKLDEIQKILDVVLEPEAKFTDLTENKEFSDDDKIELNSVFRKTMILKRMVTDKTRDVVEFLRK